MVGKIPTGPLRSHVRRITRPYSISRRGDRDNTTVGSGENYESDATTVDLYVYDESDTNEVIQEYGEVRRGDLQALCLADADIQLNDRLAYGQSRYEVVEPIRGIPQNQNAKILQFSLERVEVDSGNEDKIDADLQI